MPVNAIQQQAVFTPQQQLEELLSGIAKKNQQAMADFYDQTHGAVFGLLCRLLPERTVAETVLLEVYEEVWREAAEAIKSQRAPLGWLIQLARQRAFSRIKASTRPRKEPDIALAQINSLPEKDRMTEQRHLVNRALMRLTPEQRRIFEFTYLSGLNYQEAAAQLGLHPDEVKAALFVGMQTLKNCLKTHL